MAQAAKSAFQGDGEHILLRFHQQSGGPRNTCLVKKAGKSSPSVPFKKPAESRRGHTCKFTGFRKKALFHRPFGTFKDQVDHLGEAIVLRLSGRKLLAGQKCPGQFG